MKKGKKTAAARMEGASIYDVAKEAKVSVVTVSRVFNDYPHVSQRMRQRVFAAARAAGYTPRLVTKPRVIAAILGHLDHLSAGDYKTRLLLHLVQAAAQHGYLVEFIPFDSAELATKHLVDAVVEVGLTGEDVARLTHLPAVPTILINKKTPRPEWSTICSDHLHEGHLAARHLLDHGHRRIALVLDDPSGWGVEQRRAGYEKALREALGSGFTPVVLCAADMSALEIARQLVQSKCTGCVNLSDNFGLAILDSVVRDAGRRIPEDLSFVGLENASVSPFWNPRLTTVEQPLKAIAEGAVKGILHLLEHRGQRFDRAFKGRLVERDSVRRMA